MLLLKEEHQGPGLSQKVQSTCCGVRAERDACSNRFHRSRDSTSVVAELGTFLGFLHRALNMQHAVLRVGSDQERLVCRILNIVHPEMGVFASIS